MGSSSHQLAGFSLYDLEFRSTRDDAWYSVRVVLENDTLVVKFLNFDEASDERFRPPNFKTVGAVDEFVHRFRLISQPLQDSRCSGVIEGMTVCASFAFGENDLRYYDAVVEAVHHVEHSFGKEEEECLCNFVLFWKHGPNEGYVASVSIASICLLQSFEQIDSRLATFSKMTKEKIEIASTISVSVADCNTSVCKGGTHDKGNSHLSTNQKSSLSKHGLQVKNGIKLVGKKLRINETERIYKYGERNVEETDFGGASSMGESGIVHFILVGNLEKDLSPPSITKFIHQQTSISPHAYVFPSLPSESYTRGAIVLDCRKKFKRIYDFLSNPDHIVMSSRGRPWVIIRENVRQRSLRTAFGSLMPVSQNSSSDDALKVVHKEAKEYRTAKHLRDLFTDFIEHQQRLHKRLASEEKKILLSAAV